MNLPDSIQQLMHEKLLLSKKLPKLTKILLLAIREIWSFLFDYGTEEDVELVEELIDETELHPRMKLLTQKEVEEILRFKKDKLNSGIYEGYFPNSIPKFEGESQTLWNSHEIEECVRLRAKGLLKKGHFHRHVEKPID